MDTVHYHHALTAVGGASNLSGLANSIPAMLTAIEEETGRVDEVARLLFWELQVAIKKAWQENQFGYETNVEVQRVIRTLLLLSYDERYWRETFRHPILRMMVDQMRVISQVEEPPLTQYQTPYHMLWGGAYNECKRQVKTAEVGAEV